MFEPQKTQKQILSQKSHFHFGIVFVIGHVMLSL